MVRFFRNLFGKRVAPGVPLVERRKEVKNVEIKFKVIVIRDPEPEEFEFGTIEEVQAKVAELEKQEEVPPAE